MTSRSSASPDVLALSATSDAPPTAGAEGNATWLKALAQQDDWAVERLVMDYGPIVSRVAGRIVGADPDLPDLTQEILLLAIEKCATVQDPDSFRAWLVSIASNRARNRLRSRKRSFLDFIGGRTELEPKAWIHEGGEESRESAEVQRQMHTLLLRVPEEARTMLILRHFEDLEWNEVAAATGVSESTAKRKVKAAVAQIVELAKDYPSVAERIRQLKGSDDV